MLDNLRLETEKLARSWDQHDAGHLRNYLVATVEDPRLNLQSIFTRHFLLRELFSGRFESLMDEEGRFAAALNWLRTLGPALGDAEVRAGLLHALRRGADNAEGFPIPGFVIETFRRLPARAEAATVPNYLEAFLTGATATGSGAWIDDPTLDTFEQIWRGVLAPLGPDHAATVLEPACGSANEYRFLDSFGIARLLDYSGFDLCEKNISNARSMFPGVRFEGGNVFEINAPDKSYDLCFLHDLLEHLSAEGLETAVAEICRVTRRSICIGFFQMHEGPDHIIRPVEDYYWNTLSMPRMRQLFAQNGFGAQVIHIGTFLRKKFGCDYTHNPDAYTTILHQAPRS